MQSFQCEMRQYTGKLLSVTGSISPHVMNVTSCNLPSMKDISRIRLYMEPSLHYCKYKVGDYCVFLKASSKPESDSVAPHFTIQNITSLGISSITLMLQISVLLKQFEGAFARIKTAYLKKISTI
jgi:hypothetical protein